MNWRLVGLCENEINKYIPYPVSHVAEGAARGAGGDPGKRDEDGEDAVSRGPETKCIVS